MKTEEQKNPTEDLSTRKTKRLPQDFLEAKGRLVRLISIGNHADRLGALSVLAYCYDHNLQNLEERIAWMNASSRHDAQTVLKIAHLFKTRSRKLVTLAEYRKFHRMLERLVKPITLDRLEKSGIVKTTEFDWSNTDCDEDEDLDSK